MNRKIQIYFGIAILGALLGLIYSTVSTVDFIAHLDRQLHPVSCTLLPGIVEAGQLGPDVEGCKVAMFSPFSSFMREQYWGGIPISLFAVGLFGFALVLAVWTLIFGKEDELMPTLFMLFAGLVSILATIYFFLVSLTKLHTICTTCAGTYLSSILLLVGAILVFSAGKSARRGSVIPEAAIGGRGLPFLILAVEMGAAAFLPVLVYASALPSYAAYVTGCESLKVREDKAGVLLNTGTGQGGTEALLVLDPLCPACKAFHRRLAESRLAPKLAYKILLLPLDSDCNWMVKDSLHPGACLLSRAMLCAGKDAGAMLDFIYENQDELRAQGNAKALPAIKDQLLAKFPAVKDCVDSADTKIKLNKSLHFAVANSLPVLTPQLYLNGKRLCDEDTDLGLDYALTTLLAKKK